jgi:hypothetical protein
VVSYNRATTSGVDRVWADSRPVTSFRKDILRRIYIGIIRDRRLMELPSHTDAYTE